MGRWTSGTLGRQDVRTSGRRDVGDVGTSGTLGREDVRTRMKRLGRVGRWGRGTGTLHGTEGMDNLKAGKLDGDQKLSVIKGSLEELPRHEK